MKQIGAVQREVAVPMSLTAEVSVVSAYVAIALAAGIGVWLRWRELGSQCLWLDEAYSAWIVTHGPAEITRLIQADTAPPLYYLLLRGWAILFGHSEAALRSLSAVCGTLTLAIVYFLAHKFLRNRWSVAAAMTLMALSPMQVYYSQEVRFYELMSLLGAVGFYMLLRVTEQPTKWRCAALSLIVTACLYTHNMLAFYLAAINLAWLLLIVSPRFPDQRGWRKLWSRCLPMVTVNLIAAVLFVPWVPSLLSQMKGVAGSFWLSKPDVRSFLEATVQLFGVNNYPVWRLPQSLQAAIWPQELHLHHAVVTALAMVLLVMAFAGKRRLDRRALAALIFAVLPVLMVFVCSQIKQPVFIARVFIASTVVLPILLAMALEPSRSPRILRPVASALILILIVLSALSLYDALRLERKVDWRSLAAWVEQLPPLRRLIVFLPNEQQPLFDYYYHPTSRGQLDETGLPIGFFDTDPPRTMRRVLSDSDLATLHQAVASGKYQEILVVVSRQWWFDPGKLAPAALRRLGAAEQECEYKGIQIWRLALGARP